MSSPYLLSLFLSPSSSLPLPPFPLSIAFSIYWLCDENAWMNRKRNNEFFNPILSNRSGHIDGYYKDIELCGNEPIIMFEEFNRKKKKQCRQQQQMPEIISSNIKDKKNSENLLNIATDKYRSLIPRICQGINS
jgi:hypothetical protein